MASEQENRIVAEVMDNMKMSETEESSARRYVRRAVDKILIYCCREDLPERLEGTAAQIAEDMLKADLLVSTGKETSSVTRGDTTISYRDPSASRSATVDFMKNYETSLNHYKKMRLPKDNHAGSVFKSGTEGKRMYQDVPCALSSHSGGALAQSSSTASVDTSYSLFVRPEIDILENDFLIISRLGKVIEALAGAAERQPSHNNVPVRLDDPVV